MKRYVWVLGSLVLTVVVVVAAISAKDARATAQPAPAQVVYKVPDIPARLPESTAIKIAMQELTEQGRSQVRNVKAQYVLYHSKSVTEKPAWLVKMEGMKLPAHGPGGGYFINHTFVVDDATGKVVEIFSKEFVRN